MAETLHTLAEAVAVALAPLVESLSSTEAFEGLLAQLGWEAPPGLHALLACAEPAAAVVVGLQEAVAASRAEPPDPVTAAGAYADLAVALANVTTSIVSAAETLDTDPVVGAPFIEATQIHRELPRRLTDFLLVVYVSRTSPVLAASLSLAGVFETEMFEPDPALFRTRHIRYSIRFERIPLLFNEPKTLLADVYGWGTPDYLAVKLLERIGELFRSLGARVRKRQLPASAEARLLGPQSPAVPPAGPPAVQIFASLLSALLPQDNLDVGVTVFELRPSGPDATDAGFGAMPYVVGYDQTEIALGERLSLVLRGGGDLVGGFGVMMRAGRPPVVRRGLMGAAQDVPAGEVGLGLRFGDGTDEDDRITVLSAPGGYALTVASVELVAGVRLDASGSPEPFLEARVVGARFGLGEGRRDTIVASVMPARTAEVDVDLTIGWSPERGVFVVGSASLEVTIAVCVRVGPFTVRALHIVPRVANDRFELEVSVSGEGRLGPLEAVVRRLGIRGDLAFAPGNLGPLDAALDVKPPSGLGLVLDGSVVAGAGFLDRDPETGRYAGMLVLGVAGVTITAIAIVDTERPDLPNGFSFLVLLFTEFAPIRLGLGFTLAGIGGVFALHRSISVEAIREGLAEGALAQLLFPEEPVTRSAELFELLDVALPAAPGQHLAGPAFLLGWGTPTVATARVGVLVELPGASRVVIAAEIALGLPSRAVPVVDLHLSALGVVDLARREIAIDASLHHSRLARMTIEGDAALRFAWGERPNLVLSIGGFHPAFPTPAAFPALRRLKLALPAESEASLALQAYLAVTSNTIQLGARADLEVSAAGFTLRGGLVFDALVTRSPFSLTASVSGGLSLYRGGSLLAGVAIDATISGPGPWRVAGSASVSVLFVEATVAFDVSFGPAEEGAALPAADPRPLLAEALAREASWETLPARGCAPVCAIAAGDDISAVDPASGVAFRQSVVPFERDVALFNGVPAPTGSRFDVTAVTVNGAPAGSVETVTELFAPAQFLLLTDGERLSRPAFEPMSCGVGFGVDAHAAGTPITVPVEFNTIVLDGGHAFAADTYTATEATLRRAAPHSVSSLAETSSPARRPSVARVEPVRLAEERYVVVAFGSLARRDDVTAGGTRAEVETALARHLAAHGSDRGRLLVIRETEAE